MKYLVEALPIYEENQIKDKELNRIPKAGEQWIVTNERKNILTGNNTNKYNKVFVKVIEEVKEEQKENKEEIKQEKEIKETSKPKKKKKVFED